LRDIDCLSFDDEAANANVVDLGFATTDINKIFVLFLSTKLLKIKEYLIKGFPHIGVCPWLATTSCVSCLGLFSVDRLNVLSTLYLMYM